MFPLLLNNKLNNIQNSNYLNLKFKKAVSKLYKKIKDYSFNVDSRYVNSPKRIVKDLVR